MLRKIFAGVGFLALLFIFAPQAQVRHTYAYVAVAAATTPSPSPTPSPTPSPVTYIFVISGSFVLPYSANQAEVSRGILGQLLSHMDVKGVPHYKVGTYLLATPSPSPTATST